MAFGLGGVIGERVAWPVEEDRRGDFVSVCTSGMQGYHAEGMPMTSEIAMKYHVQVHVIDNAIIHLNHFTSLSSDVIEMMASFKGVRSRHWD
jgi:hypothetical protein